MEKKILIVDDELSIRELLYDVLSKQGYNLLLLSRNKPQLDEVKILCEEKNSSCDCFVVDFSDISSIEHSVIAIKEQYSSIDVLLVNHGQHVRGDVSEANAASIKSMIETNLVGSVYFVQAVLPLLLLNRKSKSNSAIVFINSMAAYTDTAGSAGYVASKKGLLGFAGSLFEEIREMGIKVSSICPGYVNSHTQHKSNLDKEKMLQVADIVKW